MAKKSSSQEDPATLAFSAVEDALKDSVFGDSSAAPDIRDEPQPQGAGPAPQRPGSRAERARVADKQASMSGSVANDDRFQGSRILYGLQSRSNSTPKSPRQPGWPAPCQPTKHNFCTACACMAAVSWAWRPMSMRV